MFPVLPQSQLVSNVSNDEQSLLRTEGDFNLVHQLLKSPRYKIPEHLRDQAIQCISDTLSDSEDDALKLKAIQVMSALDKHNIDLVKIAMPKRIEHQDVRKLSDEQLVDELRKVVECNPQLVPSLASPHST